MGRLLERMRMHGRRGFSLIELMIAMVVMSVGLFAIIHLQVVVVRGNAYSREITEASELADAVCDYLRIRALEWVDAGPGPNPLLTDVDYFSTFFIALTPDAGSNFDNTTGLRALQELSIHPDVHPVVIADSSNPQDAKPITSAGLPADLALTQKDGLRAIYRVHYIAYPSRLTPTGMPSNDLVTVIVFVSWDNKDLGRQEQDWTVWYNPGTFFERHMVVKSVLLQPKRNW